VVGGGALPSAGTRGGNSNAGAFPSLAIDVAGICGPPAPVQQRQNHGPLGRVAKRRGILLHQLRYAAVEAGNISASPLFGLAIAFEREHGN